MVQKRGQAALEFLMTYGWAILVVLAAIGALAYFGVLSPDRFLPEKCTLPSGIACLDFRYTTGAFELVIQNAQGMDASDIQVGINGLGCNAVSNLDNQSDGNQSKYRIACTPSSGKFKGTLYYNYTNEQTGLPHSKAGELIAKIP